MATRSQPVLVAITGATGAVYGVRLLERLRALGVPTRLAISRWGETTIRAETGRTVEDVRSLATALYDDEETPDVAAPPALPETAAMAIVPCSMRTLAAVAHGLADSPIERAAGRHLRERRRLVLLVRESPLSVVHLENMLRVARAGAIVAPPVPAFYARPRSLEDVVDHTVGRLLDHLGVPDDSIRRWGEQRPPGLRVVDDGAVTRAG